MFIDRDTEGNVSNIAIGLYRESEQDIRQLKDLSYASRPSRFKITAEGLEQYNVEALIEVFRHFSKRNLKWKCFSFIEEVDYLSTEPLQLLMETVNTLQLCRKLEVSILHSRNFFNEDWGHVLPLLSTNHSLEVLHIQNNFNMLSSTDKDELFQLIEASSKLRDLSLEFTREADFRRFLIALKRNKSLRCLNLRLPSCETNLLLSKLVDILSQHLELHSLSINVEYVTDKLRERTVDFLKCSRIQTLSVTGRGYGSRKYSLPILKAIKAHPNLIKVVLPDLDGLEYSEIIKVVLPKSTLQYFGFGNNITVDDNNVIREITAISKRCKFLRLEHQHSDDYWMHKEVFEKLITKHPGVYLQKPFVSYIPERLEFFNKLNWYGQFIYKQPETPLSHWPQLLHRASSDPNGIFDRSRYPSVVFELLRSAEFLGKGRFEVDCDMNTQGSRKRKLANVTAGYS